MYYAIIGTFSENIVANNLVVVAAYSATCFYENLAAFPVSLGWLGFVFMPTSTWLTKKRRFSKEQ